jgi:hypothetical protein
MKDLSKTVFDKRHEDDETFDEITIRVVPRFKTSDLSGDEWRVGARIELKRKGVVLWHRFVTRLDTAVRGLPWFVAIAGESANGADEEQWNLAAWMAINKVACMQPGCAEKAVNEYRLKKIKLGRSGDTKEASYDYRVRYCARHSHRGDSDLQDNDANMTLVSGSGVTAEYAEDEAPARMAGVVHVDPNDPNVGEKIREAVDAARAKAGDTP